MMRTRLALSLWTLALAGCGDAPPPPAPPPAAAPAAPAPARPAIPEADLYVLAVGGNGFNAAMRIADLRERHGADAVRLEPVPLGEGDSEPGAVIHGDDPTRRAFVHFVGADPAGTIAAIHIRDAPSRWTGPLGIRIGSTTLELERMNGKPFRFLGFDWDYGGFVSDWTDGLLTRACLEPGRLAVRLAPPPLAEGEQLPDGYPTGDAEFTSDIPPVRSRPPVVAEFGLGFAPEASESAAEPAGEDADATAGG